MKGAEHLCPDCGAARGTRRWSVGRRCNRCACTRYRVTRRKGRAEGAVGRGLTLTVKQIEQKAQWTGFYIDNATSELVESVNENGLLRVVRRPAPKDLALTSFFGRPDKRGLMKVYRVGAAA